MLRILPLLALLAGACTDAPRPARVHLVTEAPSLELALGANAWHRVGLTGGLEDDPTTPACGALIDDGCELELVVAFEPNLYNADGNKVNGMHVDGVITIDARLRGVALQHVIAHEIAHAVFRCDHLEHGDGIMAHTPRSTWIIDPTVHDLELACDAGYCP